MYRDEVVDALRKLSEKSIEMAKDIEAPIHETTNADEKELSDLCLKVLGVFMRIKN